jgi:predicted DsbA family dithiol-disulfide isomerase
MESEQVTADCIEATEFPDLITQYRVQAVPKTVINQHQTFEGSLPENYFLDAIMTALKPPDESANA